MALNPTSEARAVGSSATNKTFGVSGDNLVRKIAIIGTYDPLKTSITPNEPVQILSEADAGDKFGFGYPVHRLAKFAYSGSNGVETWVIPQAEAGGAVKSAGEIAWTGPSTASGEISLRIANDFYGIAVASGATVEEISDAVVAAVNADPDTPVVATKTAVTFETVFTAKSGGAFGDEITITLSRETGEALPADVTGVITAMTGGVGLPDIDLALAGMGVAGTDDANEKFFTHVVHNYGIDTTTIDKVSAYVGAGNDFVGLYTKTIGRPFVCISADNTPGSGGLAALQAITSARVNDRANSIIAVPDSDNHPSEIAALATGIIARMAQFSAAENYSDKVLSGIHAGVSANRWTNSYDSLDIAVKDGISPTKVVSGEVYLQNVQTFFNPPSLPRSSNGFKSLRTIAILQDVMNNTRINFSSEQWQGVSIVEDVAFVTDINAKSKARDIASLRAFMNTLIALHGGKLWVYSIPFAQQNTEYAIRTGGTGFDVKYKFQIPGEAQIIDVEQQFDINIS